MPTRTGNELVCKLPRLGVTLSIFPQAATTIPSGKGRLARGEGLSFPNGKLVDEKIEINQWPSITGFRNWKLSFKQKVAAASRYSQEAFAWIAEVENAASFEDLEDSGPEAWQEQLDAKLSAELGNILSGEFRKHIQVKETALSHEGKMIKRPPGGLDDLQEF